MTNSSIHILIGVQLEFAMFLMNVPALGFAKLSIIFFYRRIFNTGSNRAFNIVTKILIGVVTVWMLGFFFAFLFQCGTDIETGYSTFNRLCCLGPVNYVIKHFTIEDIWL